MTARSLARVVLLLAVASASIPAQEGTLDLTRPANYANQPVPSYVDRDNTPPDNQITDLGATLGRVLFYDRRLSRNDTISCASCHRQENAFGDPDLASLGVSGTTGRHSMRLINVRFATEERMFWDERAASVEEQATQPIQDHIEMGFSGIDGDPTLPDLIAKLSTFEEYTVLFTAVFGDPAITEERIQSAIAQFVRSIQSFDSRYDQGRAQVANDGAPFPNFTPAENAGKQLFMAPPGPGGGAGCAACHRPPTFDIDPRSGNNGVIGSFSATADFTVTRSPSLRDLVDANGTPHGPFMHDGSLPTLLATIRHYNDIEGLNPELDPRLMGGPGPGPGGEPGGQQLNLGPTEMNNLVAFLRTLTGSAVYTDPKWSDPFDATGQLSLIVLPSDACRVELFTNDSGDRYARVSAPAVPDVDYIFQHGSGDGQWTNYPAVGAANGSVNFVLPAPEAETTQLYRFVYENGATAP